MNRKTKNILIWIGVVLSFIHTIFSFQDFIQTHHRRRVLGEIVKAAAKMDSETLFDSQLKVFVIELEKIDLSYTGNDFRTEFYIYKKGFQDSIPLIMFNKIPTDLNVKTAIAHHRMIKLSE